MFRWKNKIKGVTQEYNQLMILAFYTNINGSATMWILKKKENNQTVWNPVVCRRPISGSPACGFPFFCFLISAIGLVSFLNQPTHSWANSKQYFNSCFIPQDISLSLSTVCNQGTCFFFCSCSICYTVFNIVDGWIQIRIWLVYLEISRRVVSGLCVFGQTMCQM